MTTISMLLQAQQGGSMGFLIMLLLMFLVMWLFLIRPQQKRQKEIQNFQKALKEGDKVVIGGGIYGTIRKIDIETGKVDVQIARDTVIQVDRNYIYADASSQMATK